MKKSHVRTLGNSILYKHYFCTINNCDFSYFIGISHNFSVNFKYVLMFSLIFMNISFCITGLKDCV